MKEEGIDDEDIEESEDSIWDEGSFVQTMSADEMERKKGTINKAHDEDMNFDCRKCGKKISAHNRIGTTECATSALTRSTSTGKMLIL